MVAGAVARSVCGLPGLGFQLFREDSTVETANKLSHICKLLDQASIIADELAAPEQRASDPFTLLAQLIDSALANAENIDGPAIERAEHQSQQSAGIEESE